jgi:hypothetical protein
LPRTLIKLILGITKTCLLIHDMKLCSFLLSLPYTFSYTIFVIILNYFYLSNNRISSIYLVKKTIEFLFKDPEETPAPVKVETKQEKKERKVVVF